MTYQFYFTHSRFDLRNWNMCSVLEFESFVLLFWFLFRFWLWDGRWRWRWVKGFGLAGAMGLFRLRLKVRLETFDFCTTFIWVGRNKWRSFFCHVGILKTIWRFFSSMSDEWSSNTKHALKKVLYMGFCIIILQVQGGR